ncbi:MAG: DUF3299 domain-containing protein [Planctomycetes bacterium]|nr:DUF3299 domain-containing protein [Planctomycetota bacterium]
MPRPSTLALALCALSLAACGEDHAEVVPVAVVRGAPIDGSGDAGGDQLAKRGEAASVTEVETPLAVAADVPPVDDAMAAPVESSEDAQASAESTEPIAEEAALTTEQAADEAGAADAPEEGAEQEEAEAPERKPLEPDAEGVYHLAFSDLSLEGEDVDNIIDYLLFPDEFEEGEGFEFPEHLKALDGKEITISGYMIPGRIRKNMVKDFMLVRDLAGCCFGGAPNPDEWIDVVMEGDAEAEYLRYLPIKVRGKLSLIGEQDQEGYAVGVYRMKATWAGEED